MQIILNERHDTLSEKNLYETLFVRKLCNRNILFENAFTKGRQVIGHLLSTFILNLIFVHYIVPCEVQLQHRLIYSFDCYSAFATCSKIFESTKK